MPEDTEEVFGPQVEVFGYDDQLEEPGYQIAHALGAKCLPWRVRISAGTTDILHGKEALQNFSRGKKTGFIHKEAKTILK